MRIERDAQRDYYSIKWPADNRTLRGRWSKYIDSVSGPAGEIYGLYFVTIKDGPRIALMAASADNACGEVVIRFNLPSREASDRDYYRVEWPFAPIVYASEMMPDAH